MEDRRVRPDGVPAAYLRRSSPIEWQMTAALARIRVVFGCLAGAMAFLIAYDENVHRFAKPEARRRAAGTAAGAFVFFTVLALALAVVVPRVVHP